jgi:aminoglycoside phosphotransferase (APT) family kinase protein
MSPEPKESTEHVPDLGPAPQRLSVDLDTARDLVTDQFPLWADLPIAPVRTQGWDNFTFHLGDDMLVRLPSAAEYALAVEKEQRWLPEIADKLPTRVPVPLAQGRPGAGYPFQWSVYGWLPGAPAVPGELADAAGVAGDLTAFLHALRSVDASDGPQPGIHNWFRGATLRTFDAMTRDVLDHLGDRINNRLATAAWDAALAARWDGVDLWFHGDLAAGNILLEQGRLAAVIDFGTCGVGDPSCDLAVAWTLLDAPGREHLRTGLAIDDATWARGRGWALWKTLRTLAGALDDNDERAACDARVVIAAILNDYAASPQP